MSSPPLCVPREPRPVERTDLWWFVLAAALLLALSYGFGRVGDRPGLIPLLAGAYGLTPPVLAILGRHRRGEPARRFLAGLVLGASVFGPLLWMSPGEWGADGLGEIGMYAIVGVTVLRLTGVRGRGWVAGALAWAAVSLFAVWI